MGRTEGRSLSIDVPEAQSPGPRRTTLSLTAPSPRGLARSASHIKLYGFVDDSPTQPPGPREEAIPEEGEQVDAGGREKSGEYTWSDDSLSKGTTWLTTYLASLPFREAVRSPGHALFSDGTIAVARKPPRPQVATVSLSISLVFIMYARRCLWPLRERPIVSPT
jgi:hypothetical protein